MNQDNPDKGSGILQEQSLQALLDRQQESFSVLVKKCDEVYGWYREVLRLGSIF